MHRFRKKKKNHLKIKEVQIYLADFLYNNKLFYENCKIKFL